MALTPALIALTLFILLIGVFTAVFVMRRVAARIGRSIAARRSPARAIDV
ncbi:MAG: hypothetical protein AAGJ87_05585 [Pseudomonadota bacterium]